MFEKDSFQTGDLNNLQGQADLNWSAMKSQGGQLSPIGWLQLKAMHEE
jgi:hypothetical protein